MSKCYLQGSVLPFGEDSTHEFKGHRNISFEEVPKRCFIPGTIRSSRRAVSRNLNGFLNGGNGGVVYLGVLDDGTIKGIPLSQYQKDHVRVSVVDLMNRYRPPVRKSQYTIEFIPVIVRDSVADSSTAVESESTAIAVSGQSGRGDECFDQYTAHLLRTSVYCWCDKHAISLCNQGIVIQEYIIEITIQSFVADESAHCFTLQLHPLYEDEEGKCYIRMSASLHSLTHQEVGEITRAEARGHFEKLLDRLRRSLSMYELLYTNKLTTSS